MSLSIGIVGLPNVGKSTLFNALTHNNVLAANYPFATIEPNVGIVPVPDTRLEVLRNIYQSERIVPATVSFVDIAGLVAGASKGEGLGNKFLANIRECQAVCHVVRAFQNTDIVHVHDNVRPLEDIETIETELVLADLQSIENHLPKLQKMIKSEPALQKNIDILTHARSILDSGRPLHKELRHLEPEALQLLQKELQLLSIKPVVYLFNVDEETLTNESQQATLQALVAPAQAIMVCAKLEAELQELDDIEASELLESYGVHSSGLSQLISAAYETLGLQSYLTAGPKEVRAWTITKGATTPEAAGVIHTDFEKGFIAAQIVHYTDLVAAGSESAAKAAGKITTVGRDYVMQPDDIAEFRFNVSK